PSGATGHDTCYVAPGSMSYVHSFCLIATVEAIREGITSLDMVRQQSACLQPLGKALPLGGVLHAERGLVRLPQRRQQFGAGAFDLLVHLGLRALQEDVHASLRILGGILVASADSPQEARYDFGLALDHTFVSDQH